ncbi:MAG: hypothetical protein RhofKO_19810 [Rhodothermales bacterium]
MTGWTIFDVARAKGTVAGYHVIDVLGLRIGTVTGWVNDPNGGTALLKVAVRDWFALRTYLMPLGAIARIDDDRKQVRMAGLTKSSLRGRCLPLDGKLPHADRLYDLLERFPAPKPDIDARMQLKGRSPDRPARPKATSSLPDFTPLDALQATLADTPIAATPKPLHTAITWASLSDLAEE